MPFAGYRDFADCVSKNGDKDDPRAYCGSIKAEVEKGMTIKERVLKGLDSLSKQGSPGPPPRPGLVWNPRSHRWTREQGAGNSPYGGPGYGEAEVPSYIRDAPDEILQTQLDIYGKTAELTPQMREHVRAIYQELDGRGLLGVKTGSFGEVQKQGPPGPGQKMLERQVRGRRAMYGLNALAKQGPPGPPPRPGLVWHEETSRWISPPGETTAQRRESAGIRPLPGQRSESEYIKPAEGQPAAERRESHTGRPRLWSVMSGLDAMIKGCE